MFIDKIVSRPDFKMTHPLDLAIKAPYDSYFGFGFDKQTHIRQHRGAAWSKIG